MRAFDLVVFDWEGTLMDSTGNIARALQAAFREHHIPAPDAQTARAVIGLGWEEACQYLAPTLSQQQREEVMYTYNLHYQRSVTTPVLYDGVTYWLKQLQQAGYQMAIATGKSRQGLRTVLQETDLTSYFAITRTAEETSSKPHPHMLNDILLMLNMDKHRTVMVGDTVHDLHMAHNAGCSAVGMSYGAQTVKELQAYKPLHIFDNFHALGRWLISG